MSEDDLTPELGPSMNSIVLRWAPSLNICSKLKGQRKTIKIWIRYILGIKSIPPQSLGPGSGVTLTSDRHTSPPRNAIATPPAVVGGENFN